MNLSDSGSTNAGWMDRPTVDACQEPRRGDIWVGKRYQTIGITPAGVICSSHTVLATHMQSLRD